MESDHGKSEAERRNRITVHCRTEIDKQTAKIQRSVPLSPWTGRLGNGRKILCDIGSVNLLDAAVTRFHRVDSGIRFLVERHISISVSVLYLTGRQCLRNGRWNKSREPVEAADLILFGLRGWVRGNAKARPPWTLRQYSKLHEENCGMFGGKSGSPLHT